MTEIKKKEYTEQQLLFLRHLKGDAKGDIKQAMAMAGYSPNTHAADIQKSLKDEIQEAISDMLASKGPSAAFALFDLLDNPNQLGAANKLKTAIQVLDRLGHVKPESGSSGGIKVPSGGIFIMPAKEIKVVED